MSGPHCSVVIPVCNRAGQRVRNCLASLAAQEGIEAGSLEIIVSDLGSAPEELEDLRAAVAEVAARLVATPAKGLFNRCRALNLGVRAARGEVVLCTDVDMVFAPDFVATVLRALRERSGRAMVLCQASDLPESTYGATISPEDYEAHHALTEKRPQYGCGACQAAPREWFFRVRGYDEGFRGWGYEDQDMASRARRDKLELVWVTEQTSMLHQWHPSSKPRLSLRKKLNQTRFRLGRPFIRRNPFGWGL